MINENVKYYCKKAGMNFGQLAERLNITRQTLHSQTTGAATLTTINRIAAALEVPAWKLLHPDPETIEDHARPGLFCPVCGTRLYLTTGPAEHTTQHSSTDQEPGNQDQEPGNQDQEHTPEEGKLF